MREGTEAAQLVYLGLHHARVRRVWPTVLLHPRTPGFNSSALEEVGKSLAKTESLIKNKLLPDAFRAKHTAVTGREVGLVERFQAAFNGTLEMMRVELWKGMRPMVKSDGELLADWYISAYGKTPSAFMQSETDAMNAAVVVALRDLGANLSINFKQVPELKSWLEHKQ